MFRGLRIPSSYLPTGPDDSAQQVNDGRVGTALIQEYRFNQYCERLQKLIIQKLDDEFKMFLRWRGFNIDAGLFSISLCEPQNFASYRQSELDTSRIASYMQLEALPYMSKRFALQRFLGLTEEEIKENEKLWREEKNKDEDIEPVGSDLRSVGISAGDLESDTSSGEEMNAPEEEAGMEPGQVAGPVAGAQVGGIPGGTPAPAGVGMWTGSRRS